MPRAKSDQGQAIVLIAIVMSGLIVGVGLAIDAGQLFVARRSVQAAADAAAWAGAVKLRENGTAAQAISAATTDATQNGFTHGVNNATVVATSPPSSGAKSGNANYVEVTITTQVRTQLIPSTLTIVTGRGVAGVAPINQGYAMIALDTASTPGAITTDSQGSIAVTGGGIMVNSSSSSAGKNKGTVSITPSTSGTDMVGNPDLGNPYGPWPNTTTGKPYLPDPFANFSTPDTTGMTVISSVSCCTLSPGVYTVDISGNTGAWTLNPGTYVMKGTGIDFGGSSSVTGAGVTFFITQSSYPSTGGSCASFAGNTVKLRGGGAMTLTAPTSGTYQGMLIYQDPACTGDISVGGGGTLTGTGTIYAPSAAVTGNGTNSVINLTQIVAKTVDTQNADFTMTYSSTLVAQPRIPALTE